MEEGPLGIGLIEKDFRFIKVNRALCEKLGYSEEEFSKLTILAVAHPDEVERIVQKAERHFITLRLQKAFWKRGSSPRAAESSGSD